jgi:hypothetical protein
LVCELAQHGHAQVAEVVVEGGAEDGESCAGSKPSVVAGDQAKLDERREQPRGDRAMNPELFGDLLDREAGMGFADQLER